MTTTPTTADTPVLAPPTRTVRRVAGAVGLIGFTGVLVVQALVDPATGGSGEAYLRAATERPGALFASSLLLLASAILTVPAVGGLLRQARDRGAGLAEAAAVFAVLGAFGHAAMSTVALLCLGLPGGDPTQMVALVDRFTALPELGAVAMPLILAFGIGLMLMAWAAWRAGLVGVWAPVVVTVVVLAHNLLPVQLPAVGSAIALAVPAVVFGLLGLRTASPR